MEVDLATGRVNPLGYPTRWVLGRVLGRVSGPATQPKNIWVTHWVFGSKIGYPKIYLGHPLGSWQPGSLWVTQYSLGYPVLFKLPTSL